MQRVGIRRRISTSDEHRKQLATCPSGAVRATSEGADCRVHAADLYVEPAAADPRRWNDGSTLGDLLVRYLGFPFWDVLLYPVQALSDVGERDHGRDRAAQPARRTGSR